MMTEKKFREKIHILHEAMGVPYTEIGKRMGVTGQYISLLINNKRPITKQVLEKAKKSSLFNECHDFFIYDHEMSFIEMLPEEIKGQAALALMRYKYDEKLHQGDNKQIKDFLEKCKKGENNE